MEQQINSNDFIIPNTSTKTLNDIGVKVYKTINDIKDAINFYVEDNNIYVDIENTKLQIDEDIIHKDITIDNIMDIFKANKRELSKLASMISIPIITLAEITNNNKGLFDKNISFLDLIKLNLLANIIVAIKDVLNVSREK